MFRNLLSAILWSQSIWARDNDDISRARDKMEILKRNRKLLPYQIAYDATIYLLEKKSSHARAVFQKIVNDKYDSNDQNCRYIDLYSRYYLSLMDSKVEADIFRKEAKSLKVARKILRALPLPPRSIYID